MLNPSITVRKPAAAAAALLAAAAAALVMARHVAGVAPHGAATSDPSFRAAESVPGSAATGSALTETAPALSAALAVPPAVAPGGSLSLVARVANRGAATAPAVALTLTWPSTLTLLGATAPVSASAGRLHATLGSLAGFTTATLTVTVAVPSDALPGSRVHVALTAGAGGVAGTEGASAAASTRILPSDLRVEIATEARDARPGEIVTWTVLAANVAAAAAEDAAVEIALGSDIAFVTDTLPADAGRTVDGGKVRWRFARLGGASGRYIDLVTRVRPDATAGAVLAPRASITAATGITRAFDDVAVAQPVPIVVPDLWLSTLGPLAAARGGALSWQIRWGNRTGGRAKDIVVTATLPSGIALVRTVPPATVDGRTLRWERGAADPEGEAPIETVRIDAEVLPDTPARTLTFDAAIRSLGRDALPADNGGSVRTDVHPGPAARMALSVPPTLGVGLSRSIEARVLDAAGEPVADGTVVRLATSLGLVAPDEGVTRAGNVTAMFSAGDTPGTASVSAQAGPVGASAVIEVRAASLRLGSTIAGPRGPTSVHQTHPGDTLSWVLGIHNDSESPARGLRLMTELPESLALDGVAATRPITADGESIRSGGNVARSWRLDDLEPGGVLTVTLRPRVVADGAWSGSDLLFARAEVTTTTAVALARPLVGIEQLRVFTADLRAHVRLDTGASILRPGGWAVYDIGFSNDQTQTEVAAAVLTSTLPVGTRFDHWQADFGTQVHERTPFEPTDRVLEWAIDQSLSSPGALRLWLRIDADAVPASALVHGVAIGSPVPDIDAGNDARFDSTFIAGIDLRTAITGPTEAEPGALASYRIDVGNVAPHDAATLLTLTAELPSGTTLLRADDPGQATAPGRVRWDFEHMASGASRSVSFDVRLPADVPVGTVLTLRADALAAEPEGTPGDNTGVWTTRIVSGPAAAVTVEAAPPEIVACAVDATRVTAAVSDAAGRPVTDGTRVEWRTTAGRLDRSEGVTSGGVATATLAGGPPLGAAIVTARVGTALGQAVVRLIAGAPVGVVLGASPSRVAVGGTIDLVAVVIDGCGNAVADGWPVTFTAERGTFDGGGRTAIVATIGGSARARLFVGQAPGRLAVAAEYGTVLGEAVVDVVPPTASPPPPRHAVWLPYAVKPRLVVRRSE